MSQVKLRYWAGRSEGRVRDTASGPIIWESLEMCIRDRLDEGPGTILPRIVGLVSEDEARVFGDRCQTEVLGDPVFDSMLQARHRRDEFRDALDIGDRKLVVLSSTWGRLSAFSARPQMFSELLSLLPADEFADVYKRQPPACVKSEFTKERLSFNAVPIDTNVREAFG